MIAIVTVLAIAIATVSTVTTASFVMGLVLETTTMTTEMISFGREEEV